MTKPKAKNMMLLAEPVPNRLCWECAHVVYFQAEGGYSEYTPGSDMEYAPGSDMQLYCGNGYWNFDQFIERLGSLREKMMFAERCGDFKEGPAK